MPWHTGLAERLTWPRVFAIMFAASVVAVLTGVFVLLQLLGCSGRAEQDCLPSLSDRVPALMWLASGLFVAGTAVFFGTPLLRAALGLVQR